MGHGSHVAVRGVLTFGVELGHHGATSSLDHHLVDVCEHVSSMTADEAFIDHKFAS